MITRASLWTSIIGVAMSAVSAVAAADEAQLKVDTVALQKVTRAMTSITKQHALFNRELETQFNQFITDALTGHPKADAVYLKPLDRLGQPILKEFAQELSDNRIKLLEATFVRQEKPFVEKGKRAVGQRTELWRTLVKPLRSSYSTPEGDDDKPVLTMAIFQEAADRLAADIIRDGNLLKQINMEKDLLEDFLTGEAAEIWKKVQKRKGKKYAILGTGLNKARQRALRDIMVSYFYEKKFFDAEGPLRDLIDEERNKRAKFRGRRDKYSSLHLLHAFVLLINESNPKSTEQGYKLLDDAYTKLETERLAYNLVRVGLRLKTMDDVTLWKLIDHARFVEDVDGLGNLYNLAMVHFIEADDLKQATRLYGRLLKNNTVDRLSPSFALVILLRTGEFHRISEEVKADSLDEFKSVEL